jgi:DNA-binding NarL/FixJ family response regulator
VVAEKDLGDLDRPGINALKAAISNTYYRSKSIANNHKKCKTECKDHDLSAQEINILKLMDLGMNNSEIASELGIKYETLKKYCTIIYSKLGTSNRHIAIKLGLAK